MNLEPFYKKTTTIKHEHFVLYKISAFLSVHFLYSISQVTNSLINLKFSINDPFYITIKPLWTLEPDKSFRLEGEPNSMFT